MTGTRSVQFLYLAANVSCCSGILFPGTRLFAVPCAFETGASTMGNYSFNNRELKHARV